MEWTSPKYSKDEINAAGQALVDGGANATLPVEEILAIVNNWRSSHAFPLNTMQMNLRDKSKQISSQWS